MIMEHSRIVFSEAGATSNITRSKEMPNRQWNLFEILDKKSHINKIITEIVIGFNNFMGKRLTYAII